jgi:predicted ATPase/class 3 adenylate cyclase
MTQSITVLLTDIQDSTWLWEHYPDDMEHVVPDHHQLAGASVGGHGGQVIKSTGDGILAVFTDAANAVAAAIDIERRVTSRTWPGIRDLQLRIGLDSGACKLIDGDVMGRSPNLAARLQSAGHGGQILLSGATAAECTGRLPDGAELLDLGRYLIRGFDEPIAVHTITAEGLRTEFPPLRAPYSGFDALPPDESELIGRDDLIDEIERRVNEHRLVTLWGPAGVGKTRLAVRVARAARRPFHDGVRFVDLAPLRDPTGVTEALVVSLQAQPVTGESSTETVVRALGAASLLVVLDNCEHVLNGVRPLVIEVIRWCGSVRILATSREPLAVSGESTLEVRPLPVPAERVDSVEALAGVPSVRLFVLRTASSRPEFALTSANAAAVATVCRATDGVPLAVELAAARAGLAGLNVVARQDRALPVASPPPYEQAPMSAALMRTISSLEADEIELFSHLAVFDGPFTRDFARRMAPNPPRADHELDRLVRTAMVQSDDDAGHYRLLAPARDFGWARLDEEARDRASWTHARMMLAEAEAAAQVMRTDEEAAAVAAIRSAFADHRAALHWFLDHDEVPEAARLVSALFPFCLFQPQSEGHRWARMVADRLVGDEPLAAEVTGAAAIGAWFSGDTSGAVETAHRALAIAGTSGGASWWAWIALVDALGYTGELDALRPHFIALVSASRETDEQFWKIYGCGLEAISLSMFGMVDEGVRKAEHAVSLARSTGNPECLHWGFYVLGRALAATDPIAATEAFEQAMRIARAVGSSFNVGLSLVEWVGVKRGAGEQSMARAGTLDLLDLLAVSGNRSQLSQALREAGLLLADAERHQEAALALLARRGMPAMPTRVDVTGDDSGRLAELERRLGNTWTRVRVRASALSEPELIALCRAELGRLDADSMAGR